MWCVLGFRITWISLSLLFLLWYENTYIVYQHSNYGSVAVGLFIVAANLCISVPNMSVMWTCIFLVVVRKRHCLPTNYHICSLKSLQVLCMKVFRLLSWGCVWAEVVFCGFPNRRCIHKFSMPPPYQVSCVVVSEICEFNRKKKILNNAILHHSCGWNANVVFDLLTERPNKCMWKVPSNAIAIPIYPVASTLLCNLQLEWQKMSWVTCDGVTACRKPAARFSEWSYRPNDDVWFWFRVWEYTSESTTLHLLLDQSTNLLLHMPFKNV